MKISTITLLISVLILITGCATSQTQANKYQFIESGKSHLKSTIHIYRTNTSYHSLNPEKPFFYINDKLVGKLGTGNSVSIPVLPGEYTVSVKESFVFMPGRTSGKVKLNVEKNKEYFIRYSKDFSKLIMTNSSSVTATGKTTLQIADQEYYNYRK